MKYSEIMSIVAEQEKQLALLFGATDVEISVKFTPEYLERITDEDVQEKPH